MLRLRLFSELFCILFAAILYSFAAPGDWTQWRGPNRDGLSTETGLLKEWPANGPPLVWKAKGLGRGFSTVSIAGDRIFTMGDGPDSSFVHAIKLADGKLLWSTPVGRPGGDHPGTRCTPTVDGDLVFALGQFGDLVCVETATGKEHWRKNLRKDFGGQMMSGWGYSESPLVDGDKIVCTPGGSQGTVIAFNKRTGEVIWRTKDFTDSAAYSSLIIAEIDGVRQYIQLTGASVVGIAPADGRVLWRAPRAGRTAVAATPVYHDGCVFVTSDYGVGCNMFKITRTSGEFKAEQVYANTQMKNHHGGVIRVGDYVYGSDGRGSLKCMELKTGKVVWENMSVGKGSLGCADGHLYLRSGNGQGTVALVEAKATAYKEKGRLNPPDRSSDNSWAQPVITGGKLYLRDHDVLLCYDVRKS